MLFTVKKLSKLSGVTVRALHFYEQIGLLRPAATGSNGYRYYGKRELLLLQQILFFKELGFKLKEIQKILGDGDFDQLTALKAHKSALTQEWERLGTLIQTVERTIHYMKGKNNMKEVEMFEGFSLVSKASKDAPYSHAEEVVGRSVQYRRAGMDKKSGEEVSQGANALFRELARCIDLRLPADSPQVQAVIKRHHVFTEQWQGNAGRDVYLAMAQLYREHPEFRKQLDPVHPMLAEFMAESMRVFAQSELL